MTSKHILSIAKAQINKLDHFSLFSSSNYLITESFEPGQLDLDFTSMSPSFLWSILGKLTSAQLISNEEAYGIAELLPTPQNAYALDQDVFFENRNFLIDCKDLLAFLDSEHSRGCYLHFSKVLDAMKRLQGKTLII